MTAPPRSPTVTAGAVALALALAGCGAEAPGSAAPEGTLVLTVAAVGTPIAELVLEVTAADIAPPLVFNLAVENGTAATTVAIPAGAARRLAVLAFDSTGAVTHEGVVTVDVVPGPNPALAIPLTPRPGQVPVTVHVGAVAVSVNPPAASVAAGATVQLAATVTAAGGAPLSVSVAWASRNPARASVDEDGLVTAHVAGVVDVVATALGSVGTAQITVTP
jgi:hypothetical protein